MVLKNPNFSTPFSSEQIYVDFETVAEVYMAISKDIEQKFNIKSHEGAIGGMYMKLYEHFGNPED